METSFLPEIVEEWRCGICGTSHRGEDFERRTCSNCGTILSDLRPKPRKMSIEEVRKKNPQIAKILELLKEMDERHEARDKLWITFPKDSFEYQITKKSVDRRRHQATVRAKMSIIRAFTILCWSVVATGVGSFFYIVFLAFYRMNH